MMLALRDESEGFTAHSLPTLRLVVDPRFPDGGWHHFLPKDCMEMEKKVNREREMGVPGKLSFSIKL